MTPIFIAARRKRASTLHRYPCRCGHPHFESMGRARKLTVTPPCGRGPVTLIDVRTPRISIPFFPIAGQRWFHHRNGWVEGEDGRMIDPQTWCDWFEYALREIEGLA